MPDLVLFATIHVGVSIALALMLTIVYRRLYRADYLLYWAMFWVAIAVNLAASQIGALLFSDHASLRHGFTAFATSLFPFYPVLIICAGLSLRADRSRRWIPWLSWAAAGVFFALLAFFLARPPSLSTPLTDWRAMATSASLVFFAWRLAQSGEREAGHMRNWLIASILIYAAHNFALGSRLVGLNIYPSRGYSSTAATIGVLVQVAMSLVLIYEAIECAGRAALQVKEAHRRLRLTNFTLENAPLAIFWRTADGRFQRANAMASRITGYSEEELLRMSVADLDTKISIDDAKPAESLYRHKDGHVYPVEIQSSFLEFEGIEYKVSFIRDITERREAERQKARLETHLMQAQKIEAVGRLTGGIAHDFNNSLTVILGYADMLKWSDHLSSEDRAAVESIANAGIRSRDLVSQLLGFSRQQVIAPRPLKLNRMLADSRLLLARLAGEDIELLTIPGENLWDVHLDETQVDRVLMNLVANARDAMPKGGRLTLETSNAVIDRAYAGRNPAAQAGEYVRLAVSDTGIGMDAGTAAHVFEPFFTTKGAGRGTGLGLATVDGIVRQNSGFVDVDTEPGRGTAFQIYFPRFVDGALDGAGDPPEPLEVPRTAGRANGAILLVEDDELVRNMTADALRFLGYSPIVAVNPKDALAICADHSRPIDLVISDVVMPDLNGPDLRDRLVRLRPHLNVLFVSGYTANVIVRHGVLEPGVHFLQKPFSFDSLGAKIEEILAGNGG
jgi:two-component system, cell cycle sensor histidine kinase and response regulator CckA